MNTTSSNQNIDHLSESERLYEELMNVADRYFLRYHEDSFEYDPSSFVIEGKPYPIMLRREIWDARDIFIKLIQQSRADNFYWRYCPFEVYSNTFIDRLLSFRQNVIDSTERDFFIRELIDICIPEKELEEKMKSLKYDFTDFDFTPRLIKIEAKNYLTVIFDSYQHFYFKTINETVQKRKIEFLLTVLVDNQDIKQLLAEVKNTQVKKAESFDNQHPRYFKNNGFAIFELLAARLVRERYQLADYSFIYRKMLKDGFIYDGVKEKEFRDWVLETYDIEINESLKTLDNCSTALKHSTYSSVLNRSDM